MLMDEIFSGSFYNPYMKNDNNVAVVLKLTVKQPVTLYMQSYTLYSL